MSAILPNNDSTNILRRKSFVCKIWLEPTWAFGRCRGHTRPQTTTFFVISKYGETARFILSFYYSCSVFHCRLNSFLWSSQVPVEFIVKTKAVVALAAKFPYREWHWSNGLTLCLAPLTFVSVAGISLCAFRTDRTSLGTVPAWNLPADTNVLPV